MVANSRCGVSWWLMMVLLCWIIIDKCNSQLSDMNKQVFECVICQDFMLKHHLWPPWNWNKALTLFLYVCTPGTFDEPEKWNIHIQLCQSVQTELWDITRSLQDKVWCHFWPVSELQLWGKVFPDCSYAGLPVPIADIVWNELLIISDYFVLFFHEISVTATGYHGYEGTVNLACESLPQVIHSDVNDGLNWLETRGQAIVFLVCFSSDIQP